jgi:hypothetical protein
MLWKIGRANVRFAKSGPSLTIIIYVRNIFGLTTKESSHPSMMATSRATTSAAKRDFPEKGLIVYRCFLDLSGLPGGYVGGQLTTNTMYSRKILGMESDPGGYTQSSIATVRLWKKTDAR